MHPIQKAQHEPTQTQAERIELPNGCYFGQLDGSPYWYRAYNPDGSRIPNFDDKIEPYAKSIAAAMQPAPSESDEAVKEAIGLADIVIRNHVTGRCNVDERDLKICAALVKLGKNIKLHTVTIRQPAPAAADAMTLPAGWTNYVQRAEALREALEEIRDTLNGEINPSNYDHDDVCKLNNTAIEAWGIADKALAKREGK